MPSLFYTVHTSPILCYCLSKVLKNLLHHLKNLKLQYPQPSAVKQGGAVTQTKCKPLALEICKKLKTKILCETNLENSHKMKYILHFTPCWLFPPRHSNPNSSTPPVLLAIFEPVRPAPAATNYQSLSALRP